VQFGSGAGVWQGSRPAPADLLPPCRAACRFDDRTWYPLGRVIGGTVYPVSLPAAPHGIGRGGRATAGGRLLARAPNPRHAPPRPAPPLPPSQLTTPPSQGLIVTAGLMYRLLHFLNIPLHVQEVRACDPAGRRK
jgi:hypothetical protein